MRTVNKPKKTKEEIIKELEELSHESGFIYSFAVMVRHDLFLDPTKSADINWRERLSFQEINFLVGLMVKIPIVLVMPTEEMLERHIKNTYELFEALHDTHTNPMIAHLIDDVAKGVKHEDFELEYRKFFGSGEAMSEPIFYGGSGAYDFQYLEMAPKRYNLDSEWLQDNKALSMTGLSLLTFYLKKFSEMKAHIKPKTMTHGDMCRASLETFCFTESDLIKFDEVASKALLSNFSLKPGEINKDFNSLGAYNKVISHPIIQLSDGRYFVPVQFSLTESLYLSPFYWMNADKKYSDIFSKHKGDTAEDMVEEKLISVFGKENVYKNVKVKKGADDVTDIDVLAVIGNKAVILQVKSKKLTELSRKGDEGQLRKDFEEAVQQAYEQGLLSRDAILKKENTLECNGKVIQLEESIDEAYILCVSLEHYPAITHHTDVYLKRKDSDPFPIALSIFDLDILSFYLKDPFEFLYYVRQRIMLHSYFRASSEMALLGFHLRNKLFKMPDSDGVLVAEEFAQLIDANFPAMRGDVPVTTATTKLHHKWKNEEFDRLIKRVKEAGIPGFTDAIFFLYDMSGDGADTLIRQIEATKSKGKSDGRQHDFSIFNDDHKTGISFMYIPNSPEKMESKLMDLAMARKYKSKADQWLALGCTAGSKEIVDAVAFSKQQWVHDDLLEEFTEVALVQGTPINVKTGKKLGRNDKCHCGSGRKYKKCHG